MSLSVTFALARSNDLAAVQAKQDHEVRNSQRRGRHHRSAMRRLVVGTALLKAVSDSSSPPVARSILGYERRCR
jgi:hypothetical protein